MRAIRRIWLAPAALLLWAAAAHAQPSASEALATCERVAQLMDSTRVAIPELARAAEPVAENARQALVNLRAGGTQNSPAVYAFLINLRAYLALSDAVPRPASLGEEARKQFHELRDLQDQLDAYFRVLLGRKEDQLRDPDRDALRRYADANEKLPPPQAGASRVVFLGDSITDLWRLNEYFPPERDFVNRGIGGQITGQMLGRMKADVIALKPSAVLVLAGTNDIARGVPLSAIQDNLTMIAQLAEANKITPMFASLLPVSDYHKGENLSYGQTLRRPPQTIRALNDWLQKFCRERKYVYVDYYSKLADPAGMLPADLADDGLHPNPKGYRLMAPIAQEAIDKILQPPPPAKTRNPIWRIFGGADSKTGTEPRP
jgi:lysophospholipase L1-like esterase